MFGTNENSVKMIRASFSRLEVGYKNEFTGSTKFYTGIYVLKTLFELDLYLDF